MSSCLSGGSRRAACGFDLEIAKSPSSTSTTTRAASHHTPSPSSTLSESNSPLTISTRKPRTPRKRPNQTYNEAAALLSTAYPNIFASNSYSAKKALSNSLFFGIQSHKNGYEEASELLLPFGSIEEPGFLFHPPLEAKSDIFFEHREVDFEEKSGGEGEIDDSEANRVALSDDFDAESILATEIEEGIDSIMGNVGSSDEEITRNQALSLGGNCYGIGRLGQMTMNPLYGIPMGLGFFTNLQLGFGLRSALRDIDDANWWRFPTVGFDQISPIIHTTAAGNSKKKPTVKADAKKKKKVTAPPPAAESKRCKSNAESNQNASTKQRPAGLLLKLNYDGVLEAWSDKALPLSDEIIGLDVHAKVEHIDFFGKGEGVGGGGPREDGVLRYEEKRRNRLSRNSKKIRYQVRKVNADQRPRFRDVS